MHETAIAVGIIREAERHGRVLELDLEIGELAHVPAHELVEALRRMIPWKVHHTEKPARVRCACGFIGHPTVLERGHDAFLIECPDCKAIPDIVDGTDIKIVKVRVA
ncbi:MAG: hydrogenase/urease maturation nickel metallochaperone HypA [Nanoarchaeota archaeon]